MGALVTIAVVVGIVLLVRASRKAAEHNSAVRASQAAAVEAARQSAEYELRALSAWSATKSWPNLNADVSGIILGPGETCVAISHDVMAIELHKHTHYEGRSAGVSVRVMKGVTLRSGSFRGQPVTTISADVADVGSLYVTTSRVVFAGGQEVVEVPLKKLADARGEVGKLELLVANRAHPFVFRFGESYRAPVLAAAAKTMASVAAVK